MFESMLQGEMDSHKAVNTAYGKLGVSVPRYREGSFEPKAIPKRTKDVSGIEDKVLSMYAKGMAVP